MVIKCNVFSTPTSLCGFELIINTADKAFASLGLWRQYSYIQVTPSNLIGPFWKVESQWFRTKVRPPCITTIGFRDDDTDVDLAFDMNSKGGNFLCKLARYANFLKFIHVLG